MCSSDEKNSPASVFFVAPIKVVCRGDGRIFLRGMQNRCLIGCSNFMLMLHIVMATRPFVAVCMHLQAKLNSHRGMMKRKWDDRA